MPFFLKRGHGNGAEAPEPLPPEGGTLAVASSRNNGLFALRFWRLGGSSTARGSPVTPRSGVTGTILRQGYV